jgi:hypothetical protein
LIFFQSGNLFSQYALSVTQFPFIEGPAGDIAPQCTGGMIYDDNTWENGYSWSSGFGIGKFVMKLTPPAYPFTINQVCLALTRSLAGNANWTFDIVVYDTTGTGGGPGNLITTIANQVAVNVPLWTNVSWFDFNNLTTIPPLTSGSYYIGISWDPAVQGGHFIAGDESTTTPLRPGYGFINNVWSTLQTDFPLYRAIGVRADGVGQILSHDIAVGPFLSLPSSFTQGNNYSIKARVRNTGSSNEVNIPIKFFVDNNQAGSVNLNLNSGAVDSVSFNWTAVSGNHTLRIFSELVTDLNRTNDTVKTNIFVLAGSPLPGGSITVCRNGLNKPILDNQTVRDSMQITIPPWGFGIRDVNVKIDTVLHTWDSDLEFRLIHNGINVNIIDNAGGAGDNFIGTILNDSASTPIASGTAPFTGSFRPSFPLSEFNDFGANPNGFWTLTIEDGFGGDTGLLKAWCITIQFYTYVGGVGTVTVPNYYALEQNYPNPFNPSTKIKYALPEAGNVKIIVFDILGREVTTLVNEYHNSGIYETEFDASLLASGIYFYRMESGMFTETRKMLLVK